MYLLDTTVISEAMRLRPAPPVRDWFDRTPDALRFTSVLVIGEVRKGLAHSRRSGMEQWLSTAIASLEDRILPITLEIADNWGAMSGEALRRGSPLPAIDSLIAATAMVHDLTIVTRNTADFERCGARVLSPWTMIPSARRLP